MSTVPELEKLLDASDRCPITECRECRESLCPYDTLRDVLFPGDGTTDTLRALVNVAKAAQTFVLSGKYDADFDVTRYSDSTRLCLNAVLDQLFPDEESGVVQDAQHCPICNGHGGGGFDRNGSHSADEYREYPCPACGKEWDGIEEADDE